MKYKFKTKPYSHQLAALEKSWNRETYAYFMEMGTGKTKVLIDNVAMLYDRGKIDGALIISPKGVMDTWYSQELPAHLPNHIENVSVLWQANITKSQSNKLGTLFKTDERLHILVMNVEALSTQKGLSFAQKFLFSHKTLMCIDESTTIKNPKAKRTKNIIALAPRAQYRRILTGSPVTKNPLDLYSQCEFLNEEHLDFTSYYAFRNRYAEMKTLHLSGRSIQVVSHFKNLDELAEQLMLLDLGRNDAGKVSKINSVKVTESFKIERYSHVMHIVSNVEGTFNNKFTKFDTLLSGFPAGTVSGAPKIRAMEIIDELETTRRKVYAGGIGYFSANGDFDTCIALRTAISKKNKFYVQSGAGIVADSKPINEYKETINKAKALLKALE